MIVTVGSVYSVNCHGGKNMRKGCRASKNEKKCEYYDYGLGRCRLGKVKATCSLIEQPKSGKKAADAKFTRQFYS